MIYVTFEKGEIKANRFTITNLKRPFQNIVHSTKIAKQRRPIDTFMDGTRLLKKLLIYEIPIKKSTYGTLFRSSIQGFPSHWVYETNKTISPLFRDKVLHKILHEDLLKEDEAFENIRQHLKVIMNLLVKSYDFDLILTDIENLASFTLPLPIIYDDAKLVSVPPPSTVRLKTVRALLRKHESKLPLKTFDWQLLSHISLTRHSTFDLNRLKGYTNILIISGTNPYYAGFLARELGRVRRDKEEATERSKLTFNPLPVTLFSVI